MTTGCIRIPLSMLPRQCYIFVRFALFLLVTSVVMSASSYAAACNKAFSEVFREVSSSVVRITSVSIDPYSQLERVSVGVGAGVVIDGEGHIVTNAHCVYETNELFVSVDDNEMLTAEVVGTDPITDIAIVKVNQAGVSLKEAKLGHSANLAIGESVVAIGYPLGIGKTATRGIVSAIERVVPLSTFSWMAPFIQTDAAINPGNSGGPLVDSCGEVVGINALYAEDVQNINFAIPIDLVRELVPELLKKGRVVRAWHGINGRIVPMQLVYTLGLVPGFLVETVEPGSPAEKIELQGGTLPIKIGMEEYLLGGDIITKVNGEEIRDIETVARIARSLEVGDTVHLEYWREGKTLTVEVVLPERPTLPGDVRRFRH